MRHSDVRVTLGTYAHLLVEDLRAAADAHTPLPETFPGAAFVPRSKAQAENLSPIEPHTLRQERSSASKRSKRFSERSAVWIGAGNGSRTRDPQLGKTKRRVCRTM